MEIRDSLLDLAKTSKKTDEIGELFSLAVKKVLGEGPARNEIFTEIRASQAYNLCSRQAVYSKILPVPPTKVVKGLMSMRLRMDVGTYLHWYLQNQVFGPIGVLKGSWVKIEGGKKLWVDDSFWPGGQPAEDVADSSHWQFVEPLLRDSEVLVTGHCDGKICLNRLRAFMEGKDVNSITEESLVLLEIKTTDDNVLRQVKDDGINKIEPSYKCQATIYQKITGIKSTVFLYMDRKYFGMIAVLYEGESKYWDLAVSKSEAIKIALRDKKLPERHIECPFAGAKRVEGCAFSEPCFLEEPEVVWDLVTERE